MTQISIKHQEIKQVIEFLNEIELKPKQSRKRSIFIKHLAERLELISEWEMEIVKRHAVLGEDGKPKEVEEGSFELLDGHIDSFKKDHIELMEETFNYAIIGEIHSTIKQVLDEYDQPLKGVEANVYSLLCDMFGVE
jgi:hypothetical protein